MFTRYSHQMYDEIVQNDKRKSLLAMVTAMDDAAEVCVVKCFIILLIFGRSFGQFQDILLVLE